MSRSRQAYAFTRSFESRGWKFWKPGAEISTKKGGTKTRQQNWWNGVEENLYAKIIVTFSQFFHSLPVPTKLTKITIYGTSAPFLFFTSCHMLLEGSCEQPEGNPPKAGQDHQGVRVTVSITLALVPRLLTWEKTMGNSTPAFAQGEWRYLSDGRFRHLWTNAVQAWCLLAGTGRVVQHDIDPHAPKICLPILNYF